MKKRYLVSVVLFILILLAATTNPSKADYVSWVKEQLQEEGGLLLGLIGAPIIEGITTKKNYGLFTLYETGITEGKDDNIVALGFLNNFVWLKGFPED